MHTTFAARSIRTSSTLLAVSAALVASTAFAGKTHVGVRENTMAKLNAAAEKAPGETFDVSTDKAFSLLGPRGTVADHAEVSTAKNGDKLVRLTEKDVSVGLFGKTTVTESASEMRIDAQGNRTASTHVYENGEWTDYHRSDLLTDGRESHTSNIGGTRETRVQTFPNGDSRTSYIGRPQRNVVPDSRVEVTDRGVPGSNGQVREITTFSAWHPHDLESDGVTKTTYTTAEGSKLSRKEVARILAQ